MEKVNHAVGIVAGLAVIFFVGFVVYNSVDCGKIPLIGSYCVTTIK